MDRKNAISWFEIPTGNLARAESFYEAILDAKMIPLDLANIQMRMFPVADETCVGGALVFNDQHYSPSKHEGVLVYLNANPDLQQVLDRVENAGGKVELPKKQISPEYGYMALIIDTEGNRIGLHSNQ